MPIAPTFRITKTINGVTRELEAFLGVTPRNDTQSTLNHKHNIFPDVLPTGLTRVKYFAVGNNGCHNVDDGNLSEPNEVSYLNMDLYNKVPIRCVPVEEDLTPSERILYRLRTILTKTTGGTTQQYAQYWLKALTLTDAQVHYTRPDPDNNGAELDYALNYAYLSPTPPVANINGVVVDPGAEINAVVATQLPLTGAEIIEGINVLYDGDLRYARISEIGIYSGEDKVVSVNDFTGTPFNMTEAIFAQLNTHYTFNGHDLSNPTATLGYSFRFGKGDIIAL